MNTLKNTVFLTTLALLSTSLTALALTLTPMGEQELKDSKGNPVNSISGLYYDKVQNQLFVLPDIHARIQDEDPAPLLIYSLDHFNEIDFEINIDGEIETLTYGDTENVAILQIQEDINQESLSISPEVNFSQQLLGVLNSKAIKKLPSGGYLLLSKGASADQLDGLSASLDLDDFNTKVEKASASLYILDENFNITKRYLFPEDYLVDMRQYRYEPQGEGHGFAPGIGSQLTNVEASSQAFDVLSDTTIVSISDAAFTKDSPNFHRLLIAKLGNKEYLSEYYNKKIAYDQKALNLIGLGSDDHRLIQELALSPDKEYLYPIDQPEAQVVDILAINSSEVLTLEHMLDENGNIISKIYRVPLSGDNVFKYQRYVEPDPKSLRRPTQSLTPVPLHDKITSQSQTQHASFLNLAFISPVFKAASDVYEALFSDGYYLEDNVTALKKELLFTLGGSYDAMSFGPNVDGVKTIVLATNNNVFFNTDENRFSEYNTTLTNVANQDVQLTYLKTSISADSNEPDNTLVPSTLTVKTSEANFFKDADVYLSDSNLVALEKKFNNIEDADLSNIDDGRSVVIDEPSFVPVCDCSQEIELYRLQNQTLQEQINDLRNQTLGDQNLLPQLEADLASANQRSDELQSTLDQALDAKKSLEDQLAQLQNQLEQSQSDNIGARDNATAIASELEQLQSIKQDLDSQLATLVREKQDLEAQLTQAQQQSNQTSTDLNTRIDQLEMDLGEQIQRNDQLLVELNREKDSSESTIRDLKEQLILANQASQNSQQQLNTQITNLQGSISALENQLSDSQGSNTELNRQLESAQIRIDDLNADLAAATQRGDEFETQRGTMTSRMQEMSAEITQYESTVADLRRQLAESTGQTSLQTGRLEELNEKLLEAENQNLQFQSELNQLNILINNLEITLKDLQERVVQGEQAQSELSDYEEQLRKARERAARIRGR